MKKIFAALGAVFFASLLFAESEKVVLSIDDAVNYALENSRTLKSYDIDLEIKKRAADNSWNVFIPSVQVTGTFRRLNESPYPTYLSTSLSKITSKYKNMTEAEAAAKMALKEQGIEDGELVHWSTVGGFDVSWNFSLAYISAIQASKAAYEGQKISWEQNRKDTVLNIKKLFYGLFLQQENLKIQKDTLESARQRMVQAEANFKNGLVPEIQLLQTQVNYENTKPQVEDAERVLNQQFDTFAFLLGMDVGTKIELSGSIEPVYVDVDTDVLLEKYGSRDLDIQLMENNIKSVKIGIRGLELGNFVPSLVVNFAYQPSYNGSNAFKFIPDIGKSDKWNDRGALTLSLAWNLSNMLPWSSNMQQLKDYKQNLVQLELALETLKENQKMNVKKAVDTLNQARAQIENMNRSVELAQKAYDMQYKSYRNGTTELLDLKDAESSLNQAKLGQLNQKYQYISALMDLESILNVNLSKPE